MYVTPKSPKGGTNAIFLFVSVKFKFCRKKYVVKFLVKTSMGKVVATSFPYLTVHRRIAGAVPIYLKFMLKMTHCNGPQWQSHIH